MYTMKKAKKEWKLTRKQEEALRIHATKDFPSLRKWIRANKRDQLTVSPKVAQIMKGR